MIENVCAFILKEGEREDRERKDKKGREKRERKNVIEGTSSEKTFTFASGVVTLSE